MRRSTECRSHSRLVGAPAASAAVSHEDKLRGEHSSHPAPRYPEDVTDGNTRQARFSTHYAEGEAAAFCRGLE